MALTLLWLFEFDDKWAFPLTNFFRHMKHSLKTETDLISIADNFNDSIIDTLFLKYFLFLNSIRSLPDIFEFH